MSSFGTTRSGLLFWAALAIGASYFVATRTGFDAADMTAWKGMGVALLALWAARHADSVKGWAIAAVLALGAAGDILLETHGLTIGALAFLGGHVVAIALYAADRWRRGWPVIAGAAAAVALASLAMTGSAGVAAYAAGLGAMAGAASLGRFPRPVAIGAWLFVVSDLLIFARLGPLAGSAIPDWLIWPTYFTAQALIAHGVVSAQAMEVPDDDLHHRL